MRKILIVDDDEGVRGSLSAFFKKMGWLTREVPSGRKAMEALSDGEFDVVLLDIIMPVTDGIDTLHELKKIKPKIPVIMITAFPSTDSAVHAMKRGACDYISKPFNIEELNLKINRAIEESKIETTSKLPFPKSITALSNPLRRRIVKLMSSRQSVRLMEIVRALGIRDHTKVSFHLKVLKEEGMIKQDGRKAYVLTDEGKKTLSHLDLLESYFSK